jgi:RHS repeat-associated protein
MDYTFTGQYSYMDDPTTSGTTEGFGLMFYNARWYDPALGRFAQADSIVPPGVQGLDRYAYGLNNPLSYDDPSGHWPIPNPFAYDTLTIGFRGLLKELIGIDVEISVNINLKAIKEFDTKNIDTSINVDATISAGISSEAALGVVIYGNEGTVLDQSDFQLIGRNKEIPVTAGGCLEDICASALYTIDGGDPDGLSGEGFFIGAGSPLGIDLSVDIIGGSDYIAYGNTGGEKDHLQVPFLNERFLKKIPFLGKLFAE